METGKRPENSGNFQIFLDKRLRSVFLHQLFRQKHVFPTRGIQLQETGLIS